MSSGAQHTDDENRTPADTILLANKMRESLENTAENWKIFIDTDGDRRPSSATRLAYALGDLCIIPVQPDASDFERLAPMFNMMGGMYERGEMKCRKHHDGRHVRAGGDEV